MCRSQTLTIRLFITSILLAFPSVVFSTEKTIPLNDPDKPGCQGSFQWRPPESSYMNYHTARYSCEGNYVVLPLNVTYIFARLLFQTLTGEAEYYFYSQGVANGKQLCGTNEFHGTKNKFSVKFLTKGNSVGNCDRDTKLLINLYVCYRIICPAVTTTTTTTEAPVATTTAIVGAVVRMGSLGMSLDSEILIYRILLGVFFLTIIILIILLIRTCTLLRRANVKHSISDGRSHVSIRRVTDAGYDQYSSMAGIGDASSLTAPELYGSIARRKEMNRERKAWLRDHVCAGSHMGVPPSEDMNGLLPPHGGSIHRTSINSLNHPGHCESISSRATGMRSPPGTFPVRPPPAACHLSRQNTGDSLHYRGHVSPQPMMPSPGINGHANPLEGDDMIGHMV